MKFAPVPPRSSGCCRIARYCLGIAVAMLVLCQSVMSADALKTATSPSGVYTAWPFNAAEAVRRQNETAEVLGIPKEVVVDLGKRVAMKFVLIPAGRFVAGDREVTIAKPYYMAVYKVTQAQYEQVMGKNPSSVKGKQFPVNSVTWRDAVAFCQKASQVTGRNIHVPTEDQWENACRAGANTKYFWGDDESKLGEYCWYRENNGGTMHAVGLKKPNAWGLYDINGLMWEPCRVREAEANSSEAETAKDYISRGATWGSRPPMFVLGVKMAALDQPKQGADRFGMRAAMDVK